ATAFAWLYTFPTRRSSDLGGVSSKDSLWKLLVEGREGIIEVPPDRWNVERYYDAEPGVAGKSIALRGGFIDAIDQFDPQFFGIRSEEHTSELQSRSDLVCR